MNTRTIADVKKILIEVLNLGENGEELNAGTILLGSLAELDSMAVVSVIARLEEHFGFTVDDDEINGRVFETLGSLSAFVDGKLA
jgi:acyl carrier protein